jgi:hypothetical protein
VVLPERRSDLPAFINKLGVRNRFLLQINNAFPCLAPGCIAAVLGGAIFRNLVVVAGVLLKERSSLRAFHELAVLLPRARFVRGVNRSRRCKEWRKSWSWLFRRTWT